MPTYYIMDLARDMAETVAPEMPSPAGDRGLPLAARRGAPGLQRSFARTGFQGGLNWYRCATDARYAAELQIFSGRTIDVPVDLHRRRADWGAVPEAGLLETMQASACTRMLGCHFVDGAGHWVQQEQPAETARLLLDFLARAR